MLMPDPASENVSFLGHSLVLVQLNTSYIELDIRRWSVGGHEHTTRGPPLGGFCYFNVHHGIRIGYGSQHKPAGTTMKQWTPKVPREEQSMKVRNRSNNKTSTASGYFVHYRETIANEKGGCDFEGAYPIVWSVAFEAGCVKIMYEREQNWKRRLTCGANRERGSRERFASVCMKLINRNTREIH